MEKATWFSNAIDNSFSPRLRKVGKELPNSTDSVWKTTQVLHETKGLQFASHSFVEFSFASSLSCDVQQVVEHEISSSSKSIIAKDGDDVMTIISQDSMIDNNFTAANILKVEI